MYRWYAGKSAYRIQDESKAKARASSELCDASSQEKLLALIGKRPVPKPTQVVKARSLR